VKKEREKEREKGVEREGGKGGRWGEKRGGAWAEFWILSTVQTNQSIQGGIH